MELFRKNMPTSKCPVLIQDEEWRAFSERGNGGQAVKAERARCGVGHRKNEARENAV